MDWSFLLLSICCFCLNALLSGASDTLSFGQSLSGNQTIVSQGAIFELGFFKPEKATRSNMHFPVEALWFFMLLFSVSVTLSPAADTIFPGKSLSGGQTLISSAGNFELGFFKPGEIKQRQWLNGTQEWLLLCILPSDPCEVYSLCGSFGSCNTHISPPCRCMTGFQPRVARDWELNDWSSGCVRRTPLQCSDINPSSNGEKDRFLEMPNMILPENNQSVEVGSAEECQLICLKNCSCVAYSYNSRCFIWFGDLMDAKEHTHVGGSQETSSVLYLRLAASELPTSRRTKITVLVVFVIALMGTIISCVALVLIWRRRRMYMKRKSDAIQDMFNYVCLFLHNAYNMLCAF
ncbi:hypothetical protein J5N97_011755 [Dioscorea zingiberensis]|uniref:Apple domain-containing protein n=1 Tax=Dioscorea zingiberensis TaxID=325984 RepID=A0A9D5D3N4_9LILI|nr:hypothetical protein J5N97_011755 [Dioscorea zingiberensis]